MVIAEISANHVGSLSRAKALVEAIGSVGATHVKFQTYTADTMTLDVDRPEFRIGEDHALWGSQRLYDLYSQASTPWDWHAELFQLVRDLGMTPFSTPFDRSAVDFLEGLSPDFYKIASFEIGDTPLIDYVASKGRAMIMSTGTASLEEIDDAVAIAQSRGCNDLTLLLCTSAYPTLAADVHLRRMTLLAERYGVPVGLSDHTRGLGVSIAAAVLGATVIERHVTLRRSDGGFDAEFSLEPAEFGHLICEIRNAVDSLGEGDWLQPDSEAESRRLKRSLYFVKELRKGEVITPESVRSIRPSGGLQPKYLATILGKPLRKTVAVGTPVSWDDIEIDLH